MIDKAYIDSYLAHCYGYVYMCRLKWLGSHAWTCATRLQRGWITSHHEPASFIETLLLATACKSRKLYFSLCIDKLSHEGVMH